MIKKVGIAILFFAILFINLNFISSATINVCTNASLCNYATIQSAIDNATNGDIINVNSGTYAENQIIINKSISVIGADKDTTIIDGSGATLASSGLVRIIASGNVLFSNFTIKNAGGVTKAGDGNDNLINVGIYTQSSSSAAVYTITNNNIYGTNSADDAEDYGLYSNSGKETLIFTNNIISQTGSNAILLELHSGLTDVSYNTLDRGVRDFSNDPYFNMNYGGNDITSIQKVSHNTIDMGLGTVFDYNHRGTGITFASSFTETAGGFTNIQITDNIIKNLKDYRRGIGLWNNAPSGNGSIGNMNAPLIARNKIIGTNAANSIGIRLLGLVTDAKIYNNSIQDVDINFQGMEWNNHIAAGTSLKYNDFVNSITGLDWQGIESLNAEFNWFGSCNDPSSKILGNVDFTPWLGACILNQAVDKTCIISYDDIKLYANVSSLVCVGKVWFGVNINGTWKNYTASSTGGTGNYFVSLKSGNFTGGETVYWTVFADDCYNHTSQDGTNNFYVHKKTELTINPVNPDGENGWFITEPFFTLSNPDSSAIYYRWDGEGPFLYNETAFGLENIPNSPPKESAGILELTYWSNLACKTEPEQNIILKVDLTNPVIKDLIPKNNEVIYNNLRPTIQAYLDEVYGENSGIDKSSIVMKVNGASVNKNVIDRETLDVLVRYNPENDLLIGINNVSITAKDKAGRTSELAWYFYLNNSVNDFNMTVFLPDNGFYDAKRVKINITISKIIDKIDYMDWNAPVKKWRSICYKCKEFGNLRQKALLLLEGENNLTIRARDSFGNEKIENRSIFIDSIKPKISVLKPNKNSYFNGSEFSIKYSEENLKEITLFYGRGDDIRSVTKHDCESGKNKVCVFSGIDLDDFNGMEIVYWFNVSDVIRTVNSRIVTVYVDISPPSLDIFSPLNEDIYNSSLRGNVLFNITTGENSKIEYYDHSSLLPSTWKVLCSNCNKYSRSKKLSSGNHDLLIRATDKAGNSAMQNISFFVEPYDNRLVTIN